MKSDMNKKASNKSQPKDYKWQATANLVIQVDRSRACELTRMGEKVKPNPFSSDPESDL